MKRWILFFLALLPMGLMAQKVIINDPNVSPRTVGAFHSIRVTNGIDLFLSQDEKESLAVSALKEEFRDRIKTEVEDGVLKISFDNSRFSFSGPMKLRAYIGFKELRRIVASGASDVIATNTINVKDLSIEMSGASDFRGTLDVGSFTAKLSGASDAKLSGKASSVNIDASGASDVKAFELVTDFCNVESSGASDVQITVNKELNAKASGASDIYYKGEAVIRSMQASGASSVKKRN